MNAAAVEAETAAAWTKVAPGSCVTYTAAAVHVVGSAVIGNVAVGKSPSPKRWLLLPLAELELAGDPSRHQNCHQRNRRLRLESQISTKSPFLESVVRAQRLSIAQPLPLPSFSFVAYVAFLTEP